MRVALGWGCGVGSLLALDALLREGHDATLVRALPPPGALRAVPDFVVEEQAARLRLPLRVASGPDERAALSGLLDGMDAVAFGYLRGEEHAGTFKLLRALPAPPLLPVRHVRPDDAARTLAREGHRLFVRAVHDPLAPDLLGRFLDETLVDDVEGAHGRQGWALVRALAVDGPRFRGRVEAAAGEPERAEDGWRLGLSLRGC